MSLDWLQLIISFFVARWSRRENIGVRGTLSDYLPLSKKTDSFRQDCIHAQGTSLCQEWWHRIDAHKTLWHHLYWFREIQIRSFRTWIGWTCLTWHLIRIIWVRWSGCLQSSPFWWVIPSAELLYLSLASLFYRRSRRGGAKSLLELLYGLPEIYTELDGSIHSLRSSFELWSISNQSFLSSRLTTIPT